MPERAVLVVDVRSYWHAGTGRGSGSHLDAVVARDREGFPFLPGRTLKGLLREAVARAEAWGWLEDAGGASGQPDLTRRLFGPEPGDGGGTEEGVSGGWCGLLRVGDARLPRAARAAILAAEAEDGEGLREGLFRTHFATAIDPERGTPREGTLRGMEVAVPLRLEAPVSVHPSARHVELRERWHAILERALPLVRAVGADRSRGLGRAVLTLQRTE